MNVLELARRYTAFANAHDLDGCESMFAVDMDYVSDGVGEHHGSSAIRRMMDDYFAARPDVHWQDGPYRQVAADAAAFDFVMTGTDPATAKPFRRTGVETVSFNASGMIRRIEVKG